VPESHHRAAQSIVRFGLLVGDKHNIFHTNDMKAYGEEEVVLNISNFSPGERDFCTPTGLDY
jgi:hypothetical protein